MAKSQLFQYAVLWHPTDKQAKDEDKKSILIVEPKFILAENDKTLGMRAAMELPAEYKDQLGQIEICVRTF